MQYKYTVTHRRTVYTRKGMHKFDKCVHSSALLLFFSLNAFTTTLLIPKDLDILGYIEIEWEKSSPVKTTAKMIRPVALYL